MSVIAVIGLGYVGLPIAVAFGKYRKTIGFDLSQTKINAYLAGVDPSGEVPDSDIQAATMLQPTTDATRLSEADFLMVAVPTPVDEAHQPDFGPLHAGFQQQVRRKLPGIQLHFQPTAEIELAVSKETTRQSPSITSTW